MSDPGRLQRGQWSCARPLQGERHMSQASSPHPPRSRANAARTSRKDRDHIETLPLRTVSRVFQPTSAGRSGRPAVGSSHIQAVPVDPVRRCPETVCRELARPGQIPHVSCRTGSTGTACICDELTDGGNSAARRNSVRILALLLMSDPGRLQRGQWSCARPLQGERHMSQASSPHPPRSRANAARTSRKDRDHIETLPLRTVSRVFQPTSAGRSGRPAVGSSHIQAVPVDPVRRCPETVCRELARPGQIPHVSCRTARLNPTVSCS